MDDSIYSQVNEHITTIYMSEYKSVLQFSLANNIDEKTARLIKADNIKLRIETLKKICDSNEISLSEFFKKINL